MRVVVALIAILAGCPKREVTKPPDATPEPPKPLLVARFADLDLGAFGELTASPAGGLPLGRLLDRRDPGDANASLEVWGPPWARVLHLEGGGDRPPRTALVFGKTDVETVIARAGDAIPVDLPDLLADGRRAWTVRAIVVRDFADAPRAEDPLLYLGEAEATLPPPWSLCRPRTAEDVQHEDAGGPARRSALWAIDHDRGVRFGFDPLDAGYVLDHVEWFPVSVSMTALLTSRGLADCVPVGRVLIGGRIKREKAEGEG